MEHHVNNRFRHRWRELHRRRVWHAAGVYFAGGWLLLQILDTALIKIGLPEWSMAFVLWMLFLAFPVVLWASWRFEISRSGIRCTPPSSSPSGASLAIKPLDYLFICLSLVFLAGASVTLVRVLKEKHPDIIIKEARPNSIAVLPFENLGGGKDDDYLGRGLAEDILHRLTSVDGLRVASRTAAFELDTSNLDIGIIAQRLGVKSILEGSVRKQGNQMRIVAQLIDADSGYHLWSGSYDRQMEDLFGIYDEISAAVVTELQLSLNPGSAVPRLPAPTGDMQAYDYFLQARSMLQRSSRAASTANAQKFFAKAVERDPSFAQAWAGQCQAFLDLYYFEPAIDKIDSAETSCLEALKLEPNLLEGHVALGDLYRKTGRLFEATEEYRAALKINRNNAMSWSGLGQALAEQQLDAEAEEAMNRAIDLDPNDLRSMSALGGFYFARGHYLQAAEVYGKMAGHANAGASAYNSLGAAQYMLGNFDQAAQAYRQVVASEPSAAAYSNIGIMYFYNGQFEDASVMYREAIALAPENPTWWGNLADCLQEMEGGEGEAHTAYRTAADLAGKLLPANPENAELLTNLAHYFARLGDDQQARQYLAQALQAAPDDVYAHYYAALVHLEAGRRQQALEEITRSVELGYPTALLGPDPQFAELRNDEGFLGLIEGVREK